jgi:DNA polymerase-4
MSTKILHLDLDSFFVSVERLLDPSLNGKPVVVGGTSERGVVSSCSYEARKMGVHSAMSTRKAKQLCPDAIFISGSMGQYGKYSKMVTDIIAAEAPSFEKASIDEFYIDLTGMDKFFGSWQWSLALRQKIIAETGLPISFGLSVNKMLAKMATNEAKPNGQFQIPEGEEQAFLDPKPIGKIPFCGEKTEQFLLTKGIKTIFDLRQFSAEALHNWLGKSGVDLWQRAHGKATATLHPYTDAKSMSAERTFSKDTADRAKLEKVIIALTEDLAVDHRKDKKTAACVAIKIRYSDFETHTKQLAISTTANSKVIAETATHLYKSIHEKEREVRLIGVRLSHLTDGAYPINLFDDTAKDVRLYKAIDELKSKHGKTKLVIAQNLGLDSRKINDPKATLNKADKVERRKTRED